MKTEIQHSKIKGHPLFWFVKIGTLVAAFFLMSASPAQAQTSSLYANQNSLGQPIPLLMKQGSLTHVEVSETRTIEKHEIIQVQVNELARVSSDGSSEQRKNMSLDAILNDWVRLNGLRKIEKSQQNGGDPQVKGSVQETMRNEASKQSSQRLTESIACEIVDVKPNGNLVILGHKQVTTNNEVWRMSITGICRQQDIDRRNVITSDRIINLRIMKTTKGAVRDGTRRGWLKKFYDRVSPF